MMTFLTDLTSAILLLPCLGVCVYVVERVLNNYVQKKKRAERLKIIRARRIELARELSQCA